MPRSAPPAYARRAFLGLCSLALSGLVFTACGGSSSSGNPTAPGQGNFVVNNLDIKTVHVYVSGSEIGQVGPGATQDFRVDPGLRTVEFRERGEVNIISHGQYTFSTASTLTLRYDPGFAFNLRVINTRSDALEVFGDFTSYGVVAAGQTVEFRIAPARRDLYFRAASSSVADYIGTYNFNHTDVVEATAQ